MLGRDLVATAPKDINLVPFSHPEVDITDSRALERVLGRVKPTIVVNSAAYTEVDKAESERDIAFRVNGEAVGAIGRLAAKSKAMVVHYSTDYVFDGNSSHPYREEEATHPVNVYGASKLAGERALVASGAEFLVIRTSWLFGEHGRSFPRTMLERARADLQTGVVSDQVGRPTSTVDLAQTMWRLLDRQVRGVVHVANAGLATWYDVASHIFRATGRAHLVTPCTSAEYPTTARRPLYSALDTTRAEALLGSPLPTWELALDRFLRACLPPPVQ